MKITAAARRHREDGASSNDAPAEAPRRRCADGGRRRHARSTSCCATSQSTTVRGRARSRRGTARGAPPSTAPAPPPRTTMPTEPGRQQVRHAPRGCVRAAWATDCAVRPVAAPSCWLIWVAAAIIRQPRASRPARWHNPAAAARARRGGRSPGAGPSGPLKYCLNEKTPAPRG